MDVNHYQQHLEKVSRSFAFCIARLDGDLRGWVGLSYLLCRILDTVEDAPWENLHARERAFDQFEAFLRQGSQQEAVESWVALFPQVPEGELALLKDAHRIFSDMHALPLSVAEKIRRPVLNMFRGMRYFSRERAEGSVLRLKTIADVNQYCFFVAGVVGDLLTELVAERWPAFRANPRAALDAHHFGLFLQKINLLKDQAADEKEGRFLVPSRAELLASLKQDAEGALRYLLSLPIAEKGFRLFCAWSLFLGLASIPWAERSWAQGILGKIPRLLTQKLLASVEAVIDDNQALLALFQKMLPKFPRSNLGSGQLRPIPWMGQVYEGNLSEIDFAALGMLPSA